MERFTFNRQDASELLGLLGTTPDNPAARRGASPCYIALTPVGGIAARSGSSVSSANCTIQSIEGGTISSAGITVPIFNLSSSAVAGSVYVIAVYAGGAMVCNWEDC